MQLTRRGAARLTALAALSTLPLAALPLAGCGHATSGGGGGTSPSPSGPASPNDAGAIATITTPKGNTVTLTQPEFFLLLQNYVPNSPPPSQNYAPPGVPAGRIVLQQNLLNLMVEGLAQDQGVAPTDAEVDAQYNDFKTVQGVRLVKNVDQALADIGYTPDTFKDIQVRPQVAQIKLLEKSVTVTDAEVQTFYNLHKKDQFTQPARVHIKKIVVGSLADAQAVATAIKGGQTFESQVSKSLDTTLPDGDVPQWVSLDVSDPRAAAQIAPIKATPAGQVTPPITVPGPKGSTYWLVKVVEKKERGTLALDQVKDLIHANLIQQKAGPTGQQALGEQVRAFQSQVKISITGPQYASLAQTLTHPAPAAPSPGGSPFAPGVAP